MKKLKRELTLEATVENLARVLAFLEENLEEAECPMRAQMQMGVAAEEVYVNIAHYAYAPETGEAAVELETEEEPPLVRITFTDGGRPFDPTAAEDPDVTLSAEEREIGGLGIFMTKKLMDEVSYEYRDEKNILTLTKRL